MWTLSAHMYAGKAIAEAERVLSCQKKQPVLKGLVCWKTQEFNQQSSYIWFTNVQQKYYYAWPLISLTCQITMIAQSTT